MEKRFRGTPFFGLKQRTVTEYYRLRGRRHLFPRQLTRTGGSMGKVVALVVIAAALVGEAFSLYRTITGKKSTCACGNSRLACARPTTNDHKPTRTGESPDFSFAPLDQ